MIYMLRYKNTHIFTLSIIIAPLNVGKKICDILQCGTDRWHFSRAYFQENGCLMPGALSLLTSHITEESDTFCPHYYAQTLVAGNQCTLEFVSLSKLHEARLYGNNKDISLNPSLTISSVSSLFLVSSYSQTLSFRLSHSSKLLLCGWFAWWGGCEFI